MAKGNLFLGTAARSVGDVVMYRREGSQVSRVRVRKVANPRTDAQSLQRAAFSPVAKFFSPLAVVLERAFEGMSKSRSYSEFLKVNIKLAKTNGWLLPKGTGFFPLPYQLTKGSLSAIPQTLDGDGIIHISFNYDASMAEHTIGNFSKALMQFGLQDNDVVTLIGSGYNYDTDAFFPVSAQFVINSQSTEAFDGRIGDWGVVWGAFTNGEIRFELQSGACIAASVVYARKQNDVWRRCSQTLMCVSTHMSRISTDAFKAAAVASYGNAAGGDNPLVYLDGDELNG